MKEYTFILSADTGKRIIRTSANSLKTAKKMVMIAEGCPESAITEKVKKGRTIRTKVFKFNELSETAKDRAVRRYCGLADGAPCATLYVGTLIENDTKQEFYSDGTLYNGK